MNPNERSQIIFENEELQKPVARMGQPQSPKMVSWVIRHSGGLVKNEKQASQVLLTFALSAIIFSLFVFLRRADTTRPPAPSITGTPTLTGN